MTRRDENGLGEATVGPGTNLRHDASGRGWRSEETGRNKTKEVLTAAATFMSG